MASSITRSVATGAASVLIFTMTFVALFIRSQTVFTQILAFRPHEVVQKPYAEKGQFVYWSFRTSEVNNMIKDLAEQRDALAAKLNELSVEEARLASERKENERLRDEIARNRKDLADFIVQIKAGESVRLREEVAILNNMTPENVVIVFNEKSDNDVVKLLSMMKPDTVGPILDMMLTQPIYDPLAPLPEKRVAELLEKLKRLRGEAK
jgi:flagellar motility protein MotE (MotC chaperone)